jgi:hypothetical protein
MGSDGLLDRKKKYFIVEGSNRGAGMAFERNHIRNLVRRRLLPDPIVISAMQLTDYLSIRFSNDAENEIGSLNEDLMLKKTTTASKEFGMLRPKKKVIIDKAEVKLVQAAFQAKLGQLTTDIDEATLPIPQDEYAFLRDFLDASNCLDKEGGWTHSDGWDTLEELDQSGMSLFGVTIEQGVHECE